VCCGVLQCVAVCCESLILYSVVDAIDNLGGRVAEGGGAEGI